MEEPPGSVDDLQPQDLSTSSLPAVIDLTRRGQDSVISPAPLDALRRVSRSACYQNSVTSSPASSDITVQPGDQFQPDHAFSHHTVTLSYVSRSHVLPPREPQSFSMPPVSRLTLHPPRDPEKGLGETLQYVQQVEGPMDLAAQTLLQSLSQGGAGTEGGAYLTQCNGRDASCGVDLDKHVVEEPRTCWGLENGQKDTWSSPAVGAESPPSSLPPSMGDEDMSGDSEVIFLFSKDKEQLVVPGNRGVRDLCRDYMSPLEDPVSPSQDAVDEVFVLPRASCSPSGDDLFLGPEEAGPVLSVTTGLDSSDEQRRGQTVETIDLTEDDSESKAPAHVNGNTKTLQRTFKGRKASRRPGRATRLQALVMDINSSRYEVSGCIRTQKKIPQSAASDSESAPREDGESGGRKKRRASESVSANPKQAVSPRTRGRRVEMNKHKVSTSDSGLINGSDQSPSPQARNSKRAASGQNHVPRSPTEPSGPPPSSEPSGPPPLSEPSGPPPLSEPSGPPPLSEPSGPPPPSEPSGPPPPSEPSGPPPPSEPSGPLPPAEPSGPPPPSSSKSGSPKKGKAAGQRASVKTPPPRRRHRRRKKQHTPSCSSSLFAPKEPEIKLKYVNFRDERRELRVDTFSPYVRVERQPSSPSLCSVINYPEEVRQQNTKQKSQPTSFISAAVPSTSCLLLGRASTHGQHRRSLVCCLCGCSANAMDLGDLHGPYYPEGYQLSSKTKASNKEDENGFSDSDSSSCSVRGRGRKCSSTPRPLKTPCWNGDSMGSPAAKRARSAAGCADAEDWYSPPVLPLEPCEYWLHEDCGVWSAGVFLVRGRVYGLEEAVRAAHHATCSACHRSGASLGCFFKGCPNNYHYRCAVQSDCVLIEENFSMKCKKHRNKTFKAPAGTRCDHR